MSGALLQRILMAGWCGAAALTALSLVSGGTVQWAGVRLSLRNASRPFLVLAILTLLLVHVRPGQAARLSDRVRRATAAIPSWAAGLVLAALAIAIGRGFGSDVASGADSYGYVTHAEMLSEGRLRRPESPLAAGASWPNSRRSLAPLGWLPAEPGSLVPVYAPGYPLLMAAARQVHPQAMFAVVPVAGAITLVALLALARGIGRPGVGVAAATLLASSPAFLMSLVVPMSDLPVTAAWTMAAALALGHGRWSAIGAGAAGGLALLIRPNLLPVSMAILALSAARGANRQQRLVRLLTVALGIAAGAVLVAAFQTAYYGSPTASGYGRLSDLFALRHWRVNVVQFTRWLFETHPVVVLVAAAAGVAWSLRPGASPASRLVLLPALVFACYALYLPFDNWTYLRFLLPAFPAMMLFAAVGIREAADRLRQPMASYVFALMVAWCALAGVHEARVRSVFANAASVERFRSISFDVARIIPPQSVVITREFSGSLQYYAHLDTLRWDWLDGPGLAQAVTTLRSRDRQVFALLDLRSEAPEFETRHPSGSTSLRLEPLHTFSGTAERIALYRVTEAGASAPGVSPP
jgi:hypothetical protein